VTDQAQSVSKSPQLTQQPLDLAGQSTTSLSLKVQQRAIQLRLQLVAKLWCFSEQLVFAHGLSRQLFLACITSLLLVAAVAVVTLPVVVAQADCLLITAAQLSTSLLLNH
jgi:hypothetical protein